MMPTDGKLTWKATSSISAYDFINLSIEVLSTYLILLEHDSTTMHICFISRKCKFS